MSGLVGAWPETGNGMALALGSRLGTKLETSAFAEVSFSRPVSRILSRVTIHLGRRLPGGSSDVPDPWAGHLNGTCFALHRTGFG